MRLPDFLCVGAAKCGTTSLHEILAQHPDIYLPERKEIHFFENDENFLKGGAWYSQYFEDVKDEKVVGEITADYMFFDKVPERIKSLLGNNIKIIFMLRNPVDRAYSEYLFNVRRGYFTGTFEEAIEAEKKYDTSKFENRYYTHLYRSMYGLHIKKMLSVFDDPVKIRYIIFENEFLKNKDQTFRELFDFLEVPFAEIDKEQVFKPAYKPRFQLLQNLVYQPSIIKKMVRKFLPGYKLRRKIKDQLLPALNSSVEKVEKIDPLLKKKLMQDYFFDDVKETERITGKNLQHWFE